MGEVYRVYRLVGSLGAGSWGNSKLWIWDKSWMFLCIINVFFISTFFSVHIVVLLILFTILNYVVTWSHIILRINYDLICPES